MEFYIQIDETGNAVGYPVLKENLAFLVQGDVTPDAVAQFNYVPILEAKPELAPNQTAEYAGWSKKDGVFSMDWTITTLSQSQLLDELIRRRRDFELATSDWTQVADAPLSAQKKAEWATYRQALRNLTTVYANAQVAEDITWPVKPT